MVIGKGSAQGSLTENEILSCFKEAAGSFKGKKVLAVFPDHTRSGPVPVFFRSFCDIIGKNASQLDFLIALGTHSPMTQKMIEEHFGVRTEDSGGRYKKHLIFNHAWDNPDANVEVGVLNEKDVEAISGGLLSERVSVRINRLVLEYDVIAVCGPVFPHEVAGF